MTAPITLLTYKDVTARANVSRKTIWKWEKEGKFPSPIKVNGVVRWRSSDVDDWMATLQ